jgi:protein-tyrosine phosphatase
VEFVDIHSHVLYGLDDGAKTLEESVRMLELARESGTTDIVATPHANGQYSFNPELNAQRIAELSARVAIRIHSGCDFRLQVDNLEKALASPDRYTINSRSYLLVEFPDLALFSSADEVLFSLLDKGMAPIITHPERNAHLQRRFSDLARWVESGCYVQVTAGSFTGQFGRRVRACADELLKRGLVHFVASDAHDCTFRPPILTGAYDRLVGMWGVDRIRPMFADNPRAVLTGDAFEVESPARFVKERKWYQFWR